MNRQYLDGFESAKVILKTLEKCNYCPRNCNADRLNGQRGYCKSEDGFDISSIIIHHGEEPVISGKNGICNIFFNRCNIQCVYCQNHQISRNNGNLSVVSADFQNVISQIVKILDCGIDAVGFVSPSHFIPQVISIIKALEEIGRNPIYVYNTNGYDKVSTIRMLEGLIDVYLPDLKYMDDSLALELSDAPNYPEYAFSAVCEMYRQKGSTLLTNRNNYAESGLIIRHLVLPGYVDNSLRVLRKIAEEISINVHISLMSQYYPNIHVRSHPNLQREITLKEYQIVVAEMERIGFSKGWIQEPSSAGNYNPDFLKANPFRND